MKREHLWIHHELDARIYWKLAEGGYADRLSARQGETITLHISNSRSYFDVFFFHESSKRHLIHTVEDLSGRLQPVPEMGYCDGFGWEPTVEVKIGENWPCGVYIASFATAQGLREILFVVRPPSPRSPALLPLATNTYAAYNNVGGKCFYDYISTDRQRAEVISFERPLQPDTMGNFHIWDQFYVSWFASEGYAIDYATQTDLEAEPDLLDAYKAVLRIGHDEYNTLYDISAMQKFVQNGGSLILFTGNAFCHEAEFRNGFRQLRCYKPRYHDLPLPGDPYTQFWNQRDHLRQKTIGSYYTSFVHSKTDQPGVFHAPTTENFGFYRVIEPDHWVFAGTGLKAGDDLGREDSIVGVEADAADIEFVDGKPRFTGIDGVSGHHRILALGDAALPDKYRQPPYQTGSQDYVPGYATVTINETEHQGTIFNAATIEWGHGLYRNHSAVSAITRNVMDQLAK